jgi:molybdenum cofactor biosynthesis protein B
VLTVSDSRTPQTDRSGPLCERLLAEFGHQTVERAIVRDEPQAIRRQVEKWLADGRIQAVLVTGGSGIGTRDTTADVVRGLLTAELPGFGELFRVLSHRQIGAAAMLSRAVGGLAARDGQAGTLIFAMPGSPAAVELALRELVGPQLGHMVALRAE